MFSLHRNLATLTFLLIGFTVSVSESSCAARKKNSNSQTLTERHFIVLLAEKTDETYLEQSYGSFGESFHASRMSKTENKWEIHVQLSDEMYEAELKGMRSDKNIIQVMEGSTTPGAPTNSTNNGHSKTKPINKR